MGLAIKACIFVVLENFRIVILSGEFFCPHLCSGQSQPRWFCHVLNSYEMRRWADRVICYHDYACGPVPAAHGVVVRSAAAAAVQSAWKPVLDVPFKATGAAATGADAYAKLYPSHAGALCSQVSSARSAVAVVTRATRAVPAPNRRNTVPVRARPAAPAAARVV